MIHVLFTWLPLIGFLPMLVAVVYLLVGTLMEPATPYEHTSIWDDDDWTAQSEVGW